jgi:hypothetical protein
VRKRLFFLVVGGLLWSCTGEQAGRPQLAQHAAERYFTAWQAGDWDSIYRLEGRAPEERSVLHRALTDRLDFYHINEVRYADSSAACAVTLRWLTPAGTYSETGELYLERHGLEWQVAGYRNF